jgi:hypothetical protein
VAKYSYWEYRQLFQYFFIGQKPIISDMARLADAPPLLRGGRGCVKKLRIKNYEMTVGILNNCASLLSSPLF